MAGIWRDVRRAQVPDDWQRGQPGPEVFDVRQERGGAAGACGGDTLYEWVTLADGRRLELVKGPALRPVGVQWWAMLGGRWGAHRLRAVTRTPAEVRAHWRGYVATNVDEGGAVRAWVRYRPIGR